jgi:uncharacterized protein
MNRDVPSPIWRTLGRHSGLTRRQWLKMMTATGVAFSRWRIGAFGQNVSPTPAPATANTPDATVPKPVPVKAESFPLTEVRLLDGPFLQAQARDEKYLLQLEPDRMLSQFRVNAGLEPKAPVYGGWESVPLWADIRAQGHTLGHYLSACSLMHASTGNPVYKERVDYIVGELQACQAAAKTAFVSAFPDGETQFDNFVAGRRVTGVPWYTMHKILAGLRDAFLHCDNAAAQDTLVKLCDWADAKTAGMTDAQFQHMLGTEHGGMNEVLADTYVLTGDPKYLALAERFNHHAVLDPLSQSRDTLDRLHDNTQIPKFIGFQRLYQITGNPTYQKAAEFFWQTVVENRAFVTGGTGDQEHFFPPADFARHLNSAKTSETCCDYNLLKLTRALFTQDPTTAYADFYELALYNCILASQDPDSGMMTYFKPMRPGYLKLYCTPIDSFWCCTGTGIENHAKYGDSIYFRNGLDDLYVNLFIPSTLVWKEKQLTLTQSTRFPEIAHTTLKVTAAAPVTFTLNLRHPGWCDKPVVTINGQPWGTARQPGSYIKINRTWQNGDVVEVELPMTLRSVMLPGTTDTVAFMYGPIVLAGKLGQQGVTPGSDIIINERTYGDMLNDEVEVPVLAGDAATLLQKIKPSSDAPLTFVTNDLGRPHEITFIPYWKIAHERYSIYWKIAGAEATGGAQS